MNFLKKILDSVWISEQDSNAVIRWKLPFWTILSPIVYWAAVVVEGRKEVGSYWGEIKKIPKYWNYNKKED